jgi:hypothetical protein
MQRRVLGMTDAEQQHLPVQIVHAPDGTRGNVRWQGQRIRCDHVRLRTGGSECMKVLAPAHARQSPECLSDDPKIVG